MEISSEEEVKRTETSLSSNEIREGNSAKICRKAPPENSCGSANDESV
jgi:hypothetical protein